jgi:hypothetical protein
VATELFRKYKQVNMPDLRLADVDINSLIDYMQAQSANRTAAPEQALGSHP